MNINEIKELKNKSESKIRDILIDFSNATGLIVNDISFQMISRPVFCGKDNKENVFSCTAVEIGAGVERY